MNEDWCNDPATERQKEKLRFFGCTWDEGITVKQASDALEECAKLYPDAEADFQKSRPATEKQKEKLRFFGCTWNGDITVSQAGEALGECARQFPDREAIWELQRRKRIKNTGTFPVKAFDELDKKGEVATNPPATMWCSECRKSKTVEHNGRQWCPDCGRFVTPLDSEIVAQSNLPVGGSPKTSNENLTYEEARRMSQVEWNDWITLHGSYGTEPGCKLTFGAARMMSEGEWRDWKSAKQLEAYVANLNHSDLKIRRSAANAIGENRSALAMKVLIDGLANSDWGVRMIVAESLGKLKSPDAIAALIKAADDQEFIVRKNAIEALGQIGDARAINVVTLALKDHVEAVHKAATIALNQIKAKIRWLDVEGEKKEKFLRQQNRDGQKESDKTLIQEVTIQEVAKPQNSNPSEFIIPAREVQSCVQRSPEIRRPDTYKITKPIERFSEWTDRFLRRNQTCIGGHWLPLGPLNYVFASETISIGLCRQMADTIELKGYCVEPDARFGGGTYDRNQTFALFKPLDGDPIQPSAAYLGAANLLRLCVLITAADGKIDLVELEVFRGIIENQPGLSLTDHKRLLILEQLLAQELCSASKTAAKIAKSIPMDKRFVIGKLLVEVAAANAFITDGERQVLDKIFKALEIPPETLESLIAQICPSQWPRPDSIERDVSKNDRWLWNHWRTGHPGIVIDDTTLAGKRWNFNDWKALNARWQDLHDRLVARQKNPARAVLASGELISKPIIAPKPKEFTLDPDKIFAIQRDTKKVVAILSVLMEDESEKPIVLPKSAPPGPEVPNDSGEVKAAPQPTRFNGLDAAYHPILERLLTRDSWPKNDFKSLADEFHFMPSKIHGTLNEWSDETLGDYILDGEDPVVINRELIAKENVYG